MKADLYTKIVLTAIGLFLNVAGDSKLSVVRDATEKVDGMDAVQLVKDTDFQAAVKYIVSRGCSVVYMGEDFLNISC